ncbi:MAG: CDP-diacylglycerol--serine O-phosphatidyltransferase [Bacteroidota bacterium]
MAGPGERSSRKQGRLTAARAKKPRPEREGPSRGRVAVPSFFTLMNLLSGFLSIIQASDGNLNNAAWLIVLAAFFDLLDGLMARLAQGDSEFGVELDSLSDIVSFGVAPSFLLYQYGFYQYGAPGVVLAALPALCGAVRLARFNVRSDGDKKSYFEGIPIPAMAGTIVAFILTFDDPTLFERFSRGWFSVMVPFVVVLSGLMVSDVQFDAFPKLNPVELKRHKWTVIFFFVGVGLAIVLQEVGLFISAMGYIGYSLARAAWRFARAVMSADA